MSRARILPALLFPLLTATVSAKQIAGGDFEIQISAFATGSGPKTGGVHVLRHSVGQPAGAVAQMQGGEFELQSGFMGGAGVDRPAPGLAGAELDPSRYRFDAPAARFLGYDPGQPLAVTFSRAMNPATLDAGIRVDAVESPVGSPLPAPAAVSTVITYDPVTRTASIAAAAGALSHNTSYRLTLTTMAADTQGITLEAPVAYAFSTLADEAVDNQLAASDNKTAVEMPQGAAAEDFFVVMRVNPEQDPERLDLDALAAANRKAETGYSAYAKPLAGTIREFTAYTGARTLIEGFSKPVTIEIPYADADGDDVVDGSVPPIRVGSLTVWHLDERRKLWVRLPNPVVDRARHVVSAQTDHFSTFGLIGAQDTDLTQTRVYPIPFRPNAGDPARYGLASEGIHFDNLPDTAEITIYTLTGRQVARIRHSGLGEERWRAVNEDGQKVASGVYRFVIKSGSNVKTGKLMVIW